MPSANVCQQLMYVNACAGVPQHVRDYRACQHMLGECYAMLGHAKTILYSSILYIIVYNFWGTQLLSAYMMCVLCILWFLQTLS